MKQMATMDHRTSSTGGQLNNSPFDFTNDEVHKLDEVLSSDSVKQILSDSKSFEHLAATILDNHGSAHGTVSGSNLSSSSTVNPSTATVASGHVATDQDGLDFVDALDSLVNQLTRDHPHQNQPEVDLLGGNLEIGSSSGPHSHLVSTNNNGQSTGHSVAAIPTFHFIDTIQLDHPYACQPVRQRIPQVNNEIVTTEQPPSTAPIAPVVAPVVDSVVDSVPSLPISNQTRETEPTFSYNTASSSSFSPPSTPQRRSQRQIERIEKSVLEKIKAENAEMLKREKEEMEAAKLPKPAESIIARKPDNDLPEAITVKKEDVEDDDKVEDGLIIDFDQQEKKKVQRKRGSTPGVATGPKRKKKAPENTVKVKTEETISKLETAKENVESKEITKSTGQRSQRQRRKPKRWDDDEVEVDFSGTASELASESTPSSAKKICVRQEPEVKDKTVSSDEENEDDEDEDDPDKLWCTCRQPHNNRFMIECDGCSEWFHGTCVGVTRAKGTMFEKEGKKWYCSKCRTAKPAETKTPKVVVKQEPSLSQPIKSPSDTSLMLATIETTLQPTTPTPTPTPAPASLSPVPTEPTVATTPAPVSSTVTEAPAKSTSPPTNPVNIQTTPKKPIKAKSSEGKEILSKKVVKNENLISIGDVLKQRKLKAAGGNISSIEKKEKKRLRKLIKSSKMELTKKITKVEKTKPKSSPELGKDQDKESNKEKETDKNKEKEKDSNRWEPISKVVPLIRKQEDKKKKLKMNPIDPSFNDLFKAEPIMMPKKLGQSAPSTPNTPSSLTPNSKRPSIGGESYRKKSLSLSEQNCVSCGKTISKGAIKGKEFSIYCTEACLEKHVKDSLDVIKQFRAHSSNANGNKAEKLRVNLVEKSTGRLISGASAPTEDKVLEYVKLNPTFEVLKPNLVRRQSSQSSDHEKKKDAPKATTPQIKGSLTKKKEDGNAKQKPSEITAKTDSRRDDNSVETIRHNVKKVLKETLQTRCQEADNKLLGEDIKKIAFKIEEELFNHFNKETSNKYKTRYRSLVFNLKDPKNQGLFRKVLTGSITPDRLVRMSHDELASSELAKWRERENKHALEMIKRESEAMIQQVIVKKTHKGEEVIETKASIETIDPTKEEEVPKAAEVVSTTIVTQETPSKEKITSNALSALDLLRDSSLDKQKEEDTTDKHGQHLFDAHCKICTKKTKSDLSLSHLKSKKPVSPPRSVIESKTPKPKRVRVEFEAPTTRIIEEAVKASKSTKPVSFSTNESSIHESSEDLVASSTVSPPPEAKSNLIPSCWKGFIYMVDVAKFFATAYRISGISDNRLKDVPDSITVRGRIAPEQVLDYLKKLKSTRTDIAVIQFEPAHHEERTQYEKFFEYLNTRKRYGVVGAGKSIKDFYILPLPKDADPPEVLLPFDGPGIPSNRPNLLLGILVKNRKHPSKSIVKEKIASENKKITESAISFNREQPDRSYTPPPQGAFPKVEEATNEEPYDPGTSLTPPPRDEPQEESEKKVDEDEPYDPEENDILNIPSTSAPSTTPVTIPSTALETSIEQAATTANHQKISQLLEQLSKASNPMDMEEIIKDTISKETSEDEKKLLQDAYNKKIEDYNRQLEEQRKAAEAAFTIASKTIETNKKIDSIPGLDGSYPTEEDVANKIVPAINKNNDEHDVQTFHYHFE
uniref:PHD-type domain-containing protein n=1 Tax=Tetranychus urticae TaxID=32264 RepID=T1JTB7_TETUR